MTNVSLRALLLSLAVLSAGITRSTEAQDYDVLVRNARVIDGSGNDWFRADIAIDGDRIVRIGRLANATAARVVDATGMYVTPGFIDLHSPRRPRDDFGAPRTPAGQEPQQPGADDGSRGRGRAQCGVAAHRGNLVP